MAFHTPAHSTSTQTLILAKISIIVAVLITAFVTAFIVQNQLERYEIAPEQIPIADLNVWGALGK
jgi:hypothetical protein